jgi:hypothetical protein
MAIVLHYKMSYLWITLADMITSAGADSEVLNYQHWRYDYCTGQERHEMEEEDLLVRVKLKQLN